MSTLKSGLELFIVGVVKSRRKYLNKTQEDISKVIGVSVGYIGQIESEKSKSMYSYHQLNELAKFLDCSPKDFMPAEPVY